MEMIHWVAIVVIAIVAFILIAMFLTGFIGEGFEHSLSLLEKPL